MTSGKLTVLAIVVITAVFGVGMWYTNVYAYYDELDRIELNVQRADGSALALALDPELNAARGIDAQSSPLRFRACFTLTPDAVDSLLADTVPYEAPTPLTAPRWFDCYDAEALGAALEAGEARAFLVERDIARGIDRVAALYPDGRGFAWHQLNGTLE